MGFKTLPQRKLTMHASTFLLERRICATGFSKQQELFFFQKRKEAWTKTWWPDKSLTWMNFFTESFVGHGFLPKQNCEDRSLHDTESMSLYHENHALLRDCDDEGFKTNLHSFHNLIIALVAALLKEPEIIIVPDSCMYQIPFAALTDDGGNFVSEIFRLRIVPY